jgi:hypothetical protein
MTLPHFYIFVIISPLKRTWPFFIWTNSNVLHPRIICTKCDWIWPAGSGEDFKNFSVYFYSFAIISPWRRVIPFAWTNLNPLPERWFVPSLVKIGYVVLEKIFKWPHAIFVIISPLKRTQSNWNLTFHPLLSFRYVAWTEERMEGLILIRLKRTWPFIWTNLNYLHPRIICNKFDWIWPAVFEDFFF